MLGNSPLVPGEKKFQLIIFGCQKFPSRIGATFEAAAVGAFVFTTTAQLPSAGESYSVPTHTSRSFAGQTSGTEVDDGIIKLCLVALDMSTTGQVLSTEVTENGWELVPVPGEKDALPTRLFHFVMLPPAPRLKDAEAFASS